MISSEEPANDRKLKPTVQSEPEAAVSIITGSNNHQTSKSRSRRVSTDASASDHSDSAKVTAALDALYLDLYENKLDPISDAGYSSAPVQLVKDSQKGD